MRRSALIGLWASAAACSGAEPDNPFDAGTESASGASTSVSSTAVSAAATDDASSTGFNTREPEMR